MAVIRASTRFKKRGRRSQNPRYTLQDKVLQILQTRSQRQAARDLGVSPTTIRRWLRGEVKTPKSTNLQSLNKVSSRVRRQAYRKGAPRGVSVLPPFETIGRQNYADISGLRYQDIISYIQGLGRRGGLIRFEYEIPATPNYPTGIASTPWMDLSGLTRGDIENVIEEELLGSIIQIIDGSPLDFGVG